MLRLMQLLSGSRTYTVNELAEKFETSYRSIYRYLDTFKEAGFVIDKVGPGTYKLMSMPKNVPQMDNLVFFSEEEAYIVNSLIERLDQTNTLKAGLHRKLASIYNTTSIASYIDNQANASNVDALSQAIRDRKYVCLRNYQSGNSGVVKDRIVEPFAFTTNYIDIWAYELSSGKCKVFKISRIEEVQILDIPWQHEDLHKSQHTDIFRMSGNNPEHIVLRLSTLAKNLLVEEYPLAEKDIREEGASWILETDIENVVGAGRFILGLFLEIEILQGDRLRQYISDTIDKYTKSI